MISPEAIKQNPWDTHTHTPTSFHDLSSSSRDCRSSLSIRPADSSVIHITSQQYRLFKDNGNCYPLEAEPAFFFFSSASKRTRRPHVLVFSCQSEIGLHVSAHLRRSLFASVIWMVWHQKRERDGRAQTNLHTGEGRSFLTQLTLFFKVLPKQPVVQIPWIIGNWEEFCLFQECLVFTSTPGSCTAQQPRTRAPVQWWREGMCRFLKPGIKHPVTGRFISNLEVVATNRCFYRLLTVHTWNNVSHVWHVVLLQSIDFMCKFS